MNRAGDRVQFSVEVHFRGRIGTGERAAERVWQEVWGPVGRRIRERIGDRAMDDSRP